MNTRRHAPHAPPRGDLAPAGGHRCALTPKAKAHLVTRALDATIAATPRVRPVLVASELEPPAAPVETTKPRPRARARPRAPQNPDDPRRQRPVTTCTRRFPMTMDDTGSPIPRAPALPSDPPPRRPRRG